MLVKCNRPLDVLNTLDPRDSAAMIHIMDTSRCNLINTNGIWVQEYSDLFISGVQFRPVVALSETGRCFPCASAGCPDIVILSPVSSTFFCPFKLIEFYPPNLPPPTFDRQMAPRISRWVVLNLYVI